MFRSELVERINVGSAKVNPLKFSQSLQGVHNCAEGIQKHLRWAVRTLECGKKRGFSEPCCGDRCSVTKDPTY